MENYSILLYIFFALFNSLLAIHVHVDSCFSKVFGSRVGKIIWEIVLQLFWTKVYPFPCIIHMCNAHNGYPTAWKILRISTTIPACFFCNLSHGIPCRFAHGFYFLFQAKVYWERVLQLLLYFLFKLQCVVVVQHCTFLHILCLYNSTIQYWLVCILQGVFWHHFYSLFDLMQKSVVLLLLWFYSNLHEKEYFSFFCVLTYFGSGSLQLA